MNLIRKSAWTVLMLGAVTGCTGDEASSHPSHSDDQSAHGPRKTGRPGSARAGQGRRRRRRCTPARAEVGREEARRDRRKLEAPKTEAEGRAKTGRRRRQADRRTSWPRSRSCPRPSRTLAIKQAVCPVSGDHLGAMDKPIKVSAEGRTFYPLLRELREGGQGRPQGGHRQAGRQGGQEVPPRDPIEAAEPGTARPAVDALIPFEQAGVWRRCRGLAYTLASSEKRRSKPHAACVRFPSANSGSASLPR